jgi:hypothetical protein
MIGIYANTNSSMSCLYWYHRVVSNVHTWPYILFCLYTLLKSMGDNFHFRDANCFIHIPYYLLIVSICFHIHIFDKILQHYVISASSDVFVMNRYCLFFVISVKDHTILVKCTVIKSTYSYVDISCGPVLFFQQNG